VAFAGGDHDFKTFQDCAIGADMDGIPGGGLIGVVMVGGISIVRSQA